MNPLPDHIHQCRPARRDVGEGQTAVDSRCKPTLASMGKLHTDDSSIERSLHEPQCAYPIPQIGIEETMPERRAMNQNQPIGRAKTGWRARGGASRPPSPPKPAFAERACKPDSVPAARAAGSDHSSSPVVAHEIVATNPGASAGPTSGAPLFGLAPRGVFPVPPCHHDGGALLPHLFTLATRESPREFGGVVFCGTFPGVAPAGR